MSSIWITLFAVGAVTFAYRFSCMGFATATFAENRHLRRLLRFVPPSAFAALVAPEVAMPGGALLASPFDPRLLAGLVALGVAVFTRNVFFTLVSGMIALHAARGLL